MPGNFAKPEAVKLAISKDPEKVRALMEGNLSQAQLTAFEDTMLPAPKAADELRILQQTLKQYEASGFSDDHVAVTAIRNRIAALEA